MKSATQVSSLYPTSYFDLIAKLNSAQIDLVKVIALLTMLIDHANDIFLPTPNLYLFAVGRSAMPLFCLVFAVNMAKQPIRWQHIARRQWLWAIVTQPFFVYAFHSNHQPWYSLNILFVFAVCSQILAWTYAGTRFNIIKSVLLLAVFVWPITLNSYGMQGILLVLLTVIILRHDFSGRWPVTMWAVALFALNANELFTGNAIAVITLAILPTIILPYLVLEIISRVKIRPQRFLPKQSFYWLYCLHLALFPTIALML